MSRRSTVAFLMILALAAATGCGLRPAAPPTPPIDTCPDSGGPSLDTVRRSIAVVPLITEDNGDPEGAGSADGTEGAAGPAWTESASGHTRNCRLYWVKLVLDDAVASSPEQLLFFDHDTALGSPTANPKPYTTVLSAGEDTVTVQYQWPVGTEPSCCPTGIGTTRYRIADGKLKAVDPIPDQPEMQYLGQRQVPNAAEFAGTVIGGLSGISYDPGRDCYYVISDDRSAKNPARFYEVRLPLSGNGFQDVIFTGTRPLLDEDGRVFGPRSFETTPPAVPPDPEGIAFDAGRQRLYWSSEGERLVDGRDRPVLADPWIRIAGLDGGYLGRFTMPPDLVMSAEETGPRRNATLEGLTLTPSGRLLFAAMEAPGFGDGAVPDHDHGALVRVTAFDPDSGPDAAAPVAQYAYPLEAAEPPAETNGLSDLVALSDTEFLVIERAFSATPTVRVFRARIGAATNVLSMPSLTGARVTPMTKTLVADLSTIPGLAPLDNIEGITLGPKLADGRQSVVLVSDDNFSSAQVTQFLLFALH